MGGGLALRWGVTGSEMGGTGSEMGGGDCL